LLRNLSDFSEILGEPAELSPGSVPGFDQEGQGQDVERVLTELAVILSHVDEHALFVSQLLVLLHLIVYPEPGASRGEGSRNAQASCGILGYRIDGLAQVVNYLLLLPLRPYEADLAHHLVLMHGLIIRGDILDPPGPLLEDTADQGIIVASPHEEFLLRDLIGGGFCCAQRIISIGLWQDWGELLGHNRGGSRLGEGWNSYLTLDSG
jgi:hypothetical protein